MFTLILSATTRAETQHYANGRQLFRLSTYFRRDSSLEIVDHTYMYIKMRCAGTIVKSGYNLLLRYFGKEVKLW